MVQPKKNYTNEILDKIRAAGIEVVTDKDEFENTKEFIEDMNSIVQLLDEEKKDPVSTESLTRLQSEASMAFTTYDNILSSSQMKQSHSTKQPSKSHITLNNKLRQEFIKNILNINTKNIQPNEFLSQLKSSIFKLENHESKQSRPSAFGEWYSINSENYIKNCNMRKIYVKL